MTGTLPASRHPLKYSGLWLAGGWLLVGLVVLVSLAPIDPDTDLVVSDHTGHLIAYGVLMGWFGGIYRRHRHWRVAAWLIGLGLGLEALQGLMGFRAVETKDMIANVVGVGLGLAVVRWLTPGWCGWLEQRFA